MKLLFSKNLIQQRIKLLAKKIDHDYRYKDLVIVGILNGAVYFTTDLTKRLEIDHELTFVRLSSYGKKRKRDRDTQLSYSGVNKLMSGKDFLIIEDILDTGRSIQKLLTHLEPLLPSSVRIASLCWKPRSTVEPNYYLFRVPNDAFLVGYGFDLAEKKRQLRDIYTID